MMSVNGHLTKMTAALTTEMTNLTKIFVFVYTYILSDMANIVPAFTKSLVIKQWLEGVPRDMIAANIGLSAGAVTNVVNE